MKKKFKTPPESETIMTEIVFPNDTNPMGIIQGGRIVQLMDTACAICAQTHAGKIAVTASIDEVSFKNPAKLGDILTIKAKITRSFKTSMEIHAEVWAKSLPQLTLFQTNDAYFTFVAIDHDAKPSPVIEVKPLSKEEKLAFTSALKRRKKRIKN